MLKEHQFFENPLSNPQQKPTAMKYQETGKKQVEMTSYKEAKGKGASK